MYFYCVNIFVIELVNNLVLQLKNIYLGVDKVIPLIMTVIDIMIRDNLSSATSARTVSSKVNMNVYVLHE